MIRNAGELTTWCRHNDTVQWFGTKTNIIDTYTILSEDSCLLLLLFIRSVFRKVRTVDIT